MSGFSISDFSRFNTLHGIYFQGHDKSTVTHETLHAVGLPHTFDGKSSQAKFTYEAKKTNNLMDYSHHDKIDRFCLFGWQWKLLNSKIKL